MVFPSNFTVEEIGPQGWGITGSLATPQFNVAAASRSPKSFIFQAPFTRGGMHTLSFNVSAPLPDAAQHILVRAIAEITWNAGGHSVRRKAHVGPGTSISGIGESVSVLIRDDSILAPEAVEPFPSSYSYTVAVTAAAGVRPSSPNPPFIAPVDTQNIRYLAGDPEAFIDLPYDAGINSINIQPFGAIDDTSKFIVNGYPALVSWDARTAGLWMPLTPGIKRIGIRNTLATDLYASILFGIDG